MVNVSYVVFITNNLNALPNTPREIDNKLIQTFELQYSHMHITFEKNNTYLVTFLDDIRKNTFVIYILCVYIYTLQIQWRGF